MKNAPLWKRILREGLDAVAFNDYAPTDRVREVRNMERQILAAPIIVDSRRVIDRDVEPVSSGAGVAIPFPRIWIEGSTVDGDLWGALVQHNQYDDGEQSIMFSAFWAVQGYVPKMTVWHMLFELDGDHRLQNVGTPTFEAADSFFGMIAISSACHVLETVACVNVDIEPRRQTDIEVVHEATKRCGGHAAGYRYHVLVIKPTRASSCGNTEPQEIGNMPHHVCRGHFKEYGAKYGKKKLFGKHEGRFYIPPHMKGNAKNGTVYKDYEVAAGSGATGVRANVG